MTEKHCQHCGCAYKVSRHMPEDTTMCKPCLNKPKCNAVTSISPLVFCGQFARNKLPRDGIYCLEHALLPDPILRESDCMCALCEVTLYFTVDGKEVPTQEIDGEIVVCE